MAPVVALDPNTLAPLGVMLTVVASLGYVTYRRLVSAVIIHEFERGLLYRQGRFIRVLDAGRHRFFRPWESVVKTDVRLRALTVPAQEVLSADGVTVKVTLAVQYRVADPALAQNKVLNVHEALYQELQLALRETLGGTDAETLLATRREFDARLLALMEPKARALGLELKLASVKDLMFPGDLKKVFAQVTTARKEGLAALERARGETASLRHLANAARLLENNPALLQLRTLQSVGGSSGNTVVLGVGGGSGLTTGLLPVAKATPSPPAPETPAAD